jgi:8-oxo-dGTP pyrophosphatase MutT (NUDIX family)
MMQENRDGFERIAAALARRKAKPMPDLGAGSRTAAVLVPIFFKHGEATLLFTKRASHVRYHRGHVSFPGGVVDRRDRSPKHAALRESWEEIGLVPDDVRVLGPLDDSMTCAPPFVIYPFVGAIPSPYPFRINAREVEKIIEVPLAAFLPADALTDWNYGTLSEERYFPEFHVEGELIWGTTASIVANLLGILKRRSVFPIDACRHC